MPCFLQAEPANTDTSETGASAANPAAKAYVPIVSHILQPAEMPPPALEELQVPPGFVVSKVAENLGKPRVLAVSPQGDIYLTRRE